MGFDGGWRQRRCGGFAHDEIAGHSFLIRLTCQNETVTARRDKTRGLRIAESGATFYYRATSKVKGKVLWLNTITIYSQSVRVRAGCAPVGYRLATVQKSRW